jgi:uncharacterized membrane protein YgdD (TMEM256/DUF423 family)
MTRDSTSALAGRTNPDRNAATLIALGALIALIAVAAGAFGAHALRARLEVAQLTVYETAIRYQMYHAGAVIMTGLAAARWPNALWGAAAASFVLGVVLFTGSLLLIILSGVRSIGWITPLGGLAFIAGWALMIAAALRVRRGPTEDATPAAIRSRQ